MKECDDNRDLTWLVNVVDLLSVCAEDECQTAINLCHTLFPAEVLLRYQM